MCVEKVIAYIGLGSNIGDRHKNMEVAIEGLEKTDGISVSIVSPLYNTAPVGYLEQPDFLNAVVAVETNLCPYKLLEVCNNIEKELKRERKVRWGPRTIDMDILLYGSLVMEEENLTIPHPRMHEREFVLKPLSDIAPDIIHPILNMTIKDLYSRINK